MPQLATPLLSTHERRMHQQLMHYWDSLPKLEETGLPHESSISPEALAEWWPQMFLLDITPIRQSLERHDRDFRLHYSYMGTELVEACGGDLSGRAIEDLPSALAQDGLRDAADTVVTTRSPLQQEGDCMGPHHVWVHYRRILLPLTRDGQKVDYILGGIAWRLA